MVIDKFRTRTVLALAIICAFMTIISSKSWTVLAIRKPLDCQVLGLRNLDPSSGEAFCFDRYYLFGKYHSAQFKKLDTPKPLKFAIKDFKDKFLITGQLIKPPLGTFIITDMAREHILWTSSGIGTEWSGATREVVRMPDTANEFMLNASQNFIYEMTFSPVSDGTIHSYGIGVLTTLTVFLLVILLATRYSGRLQAYVILSVALALLILWCGMPYGSSTGWIDSGDDTSYLHWAYNLGYLFDPDLTHSAKIISSWAGDHNHHSWGVGIVLAPFLALARLKALDMPPGALHFGLMNFGVIFWGCIASFGLFKMFSLFADWRSASVMAILAVASTSTLKWWFMRNFFSHVPELAMLACAGYFATERYFKNRSETRYLMGVLCTLVLATQIRRENVVFFGLVIAYEWLLLKPKKVQDKLKDSALFAGAAVLSVIILMATNYFTKLKTFWASSGTAEFFYTSGFLEVFLKQAPDVFYKEAYGLFYWKNAYPWLALAGCFMERKAWRVWLPLFGITMFYLLMCTFFQYPNGFEWQNRFMLKLTPILFGGALIFLRRAPRLVKVFGWTWLLASLAWELSSYFEQIPKGMNFYSGDFSDNMLLFPQSWPGSWMELFYLPLTAIWMLSFVLCLKWYLEIRKSHLVKSYEQRVGIE